MDDNRAVKYDNVGNTINLSDAEKEDILIFMEKTEKMNY